MIIRRHLAGRNCAVLWLVCTVNGLGLWQRSMAHVAQSRRITVGQSKYLLCLWKCTIGALQIFVLNDGILLYDSCAASS